MLYFFKRFVVFGICSIPFLGMAQSFHLGNGKNFQKVRFQLINNLIIVPVELNGSKLSFVLDSGVSRPMLFNLSGQDSIQINNVSEILINGLGGGEPMKALSSTGNRLKINNVVNVDQSLYVIMDKGFNLSPSLGVPVHGIIGYDLFRDFVVDVNYGSKTITFHDPGHYRAKKNKKAVTLSMDVDHKRAFIEGSVYLLDDEKIEVKLMLDTGSGDALWLFEDDQRAIRSPSQSFDDFLGLGLSGNVYGKRTKIKRIDIGGFVLQDAKTAFPDLKFFSTLQDMNGRNGSLGGEILKRFNIVFDYPKRELTLSKNRHFKDPFHYNISGIEIQHAGVRFIAERIADFRGVVKSGERDFGNVQILMGNTTRLSLVPEIIVSGIRAGSPADLAGLQEGDLILSVNGKSIHKYKLQEITQMLNEQKGKEIRVVIERFNSDIMISFVLKDLFK